MQGFVKASALGHIGSDIRVREGKGGKIASFSMAASKRWRDKTSGEMRESTTWVNVNLWQERLANYAESYLGKGSLVYVEGEARLNKWTNQDGIDKFNMTIELNGFNSRLIGLDKVEGKTAPSNDSEPDEEIPF